MRHSKRDLVRLNKLISEAGFCSRREADEYIAQERVTVNSRTAQLGDEVYRTDFIRIDGEPLRFLEKPVFQKRKPEFESKRITRQLGIKKKERKPKTAHAEGESADVKEKVPAKKKPENASNSATFKPAKKEGEAKKWFSGQKKRR